MAALLRLPSLSLVTAALSDCTQPATTPMFIRFWQINNNNDGHVNGVARHQPPSIWSTPVHPACPVPVTFDDIFCFFVFGESPFRRPPLTVLLKTRRTHHTLDSYRCYGRIQFSVCSSARGCFCDRRIPYGLCGCLKRAVPEEKINCFAIELHAHLFPLYAKTIDERRDGLDRRLRRLSAANCSRYARICFSCGTRHRVPLHEPANVEFQVDTLVFDAKQEEFQTG